MKANYEEKNYIVVNLSSDYTSTVTGKVDLPLTFTNISNGNKLTMGSNGVVVGSGVNHVRVAGQIYFYQGTINKRAGVAIIKNDSNHVQTNKNFYIPSNYTQWTITPIIIPVEAGDVIKINYNGTSGDIISANKSGTFLCVEVID